jgi:dihydropteroate synthase
MSDGFPQIMGIVNVTPDSFSDGGKYFSHQKAIEYAFQLIEDGADILDIGGESTRPGADSISEKEELKRVIPVIEGIRDENPQIVISVDTTKYKVAKAAFEAGADIINDTSGSTNDPRIIKLCAETNAVLIIMHSKGTPKNMQIKPVYKNVVDEVFAFLKEKIEFAKASGVGSIVADVGIGFGKTYEHNLMLLRNIERFHELNVPILLGISRKSFIGTMLDIENPVNRDLPTLVINSLLLSKKIDILRVHNVKNHFFLKKIAKNVII